MEIYLFIIGSRLCRPSRSIPTHTKSGTAIYSNLRNLAQEAIRGKGNQKAPSSEHKERGRQLNSKNDREILFFAHLDTFEILQILRIQAL